MAILEGALLLGLAPEDFIVAVGVEGRIDVNEVDRVLRQLLELFQIVSAIDDPGVQQTGGFGRKAHFEWLLCDKRMSDAILELQGEEIGNT